MNNIFDLVECWACDGSGKLNHLLCHWCEGAGMVRRHKNDNMLTAIANKIAAKHRENYLITLINEAT